MKHRARRYVYFLALMFVFFLYLYPSVLSVEVQKEWCDMYFGNLIYLLFFMLLLYGFRIGIEDTGSRIAFEIRIYLFFLCVFSLVCLFIFYQAGIDFHTQEISETMTEEILHLSLYKYHLGFIGSYLLYLLSKLGKYPYYYYSYSILFVCLFSFFLLLYKPIEMRLKAIRKEKSERERRERERTLIMEQIEIKKALEEKEYRQKKKFEQRKAEIIYEKARELELGKLTSRVNLLEEEKVHKKPLIQQKGEEEDFPLEIHAEQLEIKNKLEVEEE